ncbi:two-component system response regulator YesN [Paenibacillus sp. SORGH_AS306]|uniref:response regulator transcription factor n=1 Tax=unclassified Paenibacillus TaxID=185978 RepID=UPI0027803029|nr:MULTISPECIES: response regulator [unclassified Paenibacillus]MDQ1232876.1 two-component system response regulator YesN [Paenibacillus sp. SORGH_AS_0306]MDR6109924.1 two-component system response regulator YesN [Paenibacillus sp. SORGH_AS_0338]
MSAVYNVLIADDEPIIREGIRDCVDWDSLGMIVTAEAEDGEEALEIALKQQIDILLVDMNMPFLDGISLMKRLRTERPHCRFVIITGHDEFKYAQEAIRLGVKDYILKPVDPLHLYDVLHHIRTEMNGTLHQEQYLKLATDQIQKNTSLLQEQFCLDWLSGRLHHEEIKQQLEFLHLPVCLPSTLALIRWSGHAEGRPMLKEQDKQLMLFAIGNIAAELLQPAPLVICRESSGLLVICTWCPPDHSTASAMYDNEQQADKMMSAVKDCIGLHVQVHLQSVNSIDEEINNTDMPNDPLLSLEQDVDYSQVMTTAYRHAKLQLDGQSRLSPLVRRARDYIQNHYHNPELTLEKLADVLQVSPTYLSRLMKRELGHSFIHVLVQIRIQKAVHLLKETELSILEIALQVGYDSQHYFSTAFKKMIGVSPNQYRRDTVEQS